MPVIAIRSQGTAKGEVFMIQSEGDGVAARTRAEEERPRGQGQTDGSVVFTWRQGCSRVAPTSPVAGKAAGSARPTAVGTRPGRQVKLPNTWSHSERSEA